jgi:aspartyl/asparaginyl beta-hydroxylase (cupin superfamily)
VRLRNVLTTSEFAAGARAGTLKARGVAHADANTRCPSAARSVAEARNARCVD